MGSRQVSVIVYGARDLHSKRKDGKHKYYCVFGIGTNKYKTNVVTNQDRDPDWNEESTMYVDSLEIPIEIVLRDKDEVLGQVTLPITELPLKDGSRQQRYELQPHRKCAHPHGSLVLEAWVTKGEQSGGTPVIRKRLNSSESAKKHHGTLTKLKDTLAHKSPFMTHKPLPKMSPLPNKKEESVIKEVLVVPRIGLMSEKKRKNSRSLSDLSNLHKTWQQAGEPTDHNMAKENHKHLNPFWSGKRAFSFLDLSSNKSTKDNEHPSHQNEPEITGLSPNEGPVDGGTKLTIRGTNLGNHKLDVIGLYVCGSDCLSSLIYESSNIIHCQTIAHKPGSGFVVVETQSGGRATSLLQFTFFGEHDHTSISPGAGTKKHTFFARITDAIELKRERRDTTESFIDTEKEDLRTEVVHLKRDLEEKTKNLTKENKELTEENKSLKQYIERLVASVMERCPDVLNVDHTRPG